jgi:hypothetical protein
VHQAIAEAVDLAAIVAMLLDGLGNRFRQGGTGNGQQRGGYGRQKAAFQAASPVLSLEA